jgi:hypothetical protein
MGWWGRLAGSGRREAEPPHGTGGRPVATRGKSSFEERVRELV